MLRSTLICALLPVALWAAGSTAQAASPAFGGVWTVRWCAPESRRDECGGFTAYLVQKGDRLCGTHFGADERQNRMDEGEPKSISGVAVGRTAVLTIRSGRNHGLYLIRAVRKGNTLAWETVETLMEGDNGEPAFVADRDVLKRDTSSQAVAALNEIARQCAEQDGRADKKTTVEP